MGTGGIDWPLFGGQLGLGALLGFAAGFTAKKVFNILLVLVALGLGGALLLQHYGLISIHWSQIEAVYAHAFPGVDGLRGVWQQWSEHVARLLPIAGSFTLGFLIGLRAG